MTNEYQPGERECPYCQADESHIDCVKRYNKEQNTYFYYVDCNLCEMSGPTKDTPEEAVKAWNGFPRPADGWIPVSERDERKDD